jgi:hypothetical protein
MGGARLWSLQDGPETISMDQGADWSGWRWWVTNGAEVRAIGVYVAAAAMACGIPDLDRATAAARETEGRSAVEQMLGMPNPFTVVVCIKNGIRHQETPPRPDSGSR